MNDKLEPLVNELIEFEEQLSRTPDNIYAVHTLFRKAHILKADLSLGGLKVHGDIVHQIEGILDIIRQGKCTSVHRTISSLVDCSIQFMRSFDTIATNADTAEDLLRQLSALAVQQTSSAKQAVVYAEEQFNDKQLILLHYAQSEGMKLYQLEKIVHTRSVSNFTMSSARGDIPIYGTLKDIGVHIATLVPEYAEAPSSEPNEESTTVIYILFATSLTEAELEMEVFDPYRPIVITSSRYKNNTLLHQHITQSRTSASADNQELRFLVVDDVPLNCHILQTLLQEYGHCDIATDGQEAVEAFDRQLGQQQPYTAIFLDIMMPVMDGRQALTAIRALENCRGIRFGERVAVIITTALDDTKELSFGLQNQINSYLVKPIRKNSLLAVLKRCHLIEEPQKVSAHAASAPVEYDSVH